MILIRREGFITALRYGLLWYAAQQEHGPEAAELLAERFAAAVDLTVERIGRQPDSGVAWRYRPGYRFALVRKPFDRWLIFYRQPTPDSIDLIDILRGERDLPRRVK